MKSLLVFTVAIATAIAVTQRPRLAADATGDPTSTKNGTKTYMFHADSNDDHDIHTSPHQRMDIRNDHNATRRDHQVTDREQEGNANRYTPRTTVHLSSKAKTQDFDHQRPRFLRKGHKRYKRPMRRKSSSPWTKDTAAQTNNSHIRPSSAQLLISHQNTSEFLSANRSVNEASLVQGAPSSTLYEGRFQPAQQLHGVESFKTDNHKSEPHNKGEAVSSQKSEPGRVNDDIVTYKFSESENLLEERTSPNARNQNSRRAVYAIDNRNQSLTGDLLKQSEKHEAQNHLVDHIRKSVSVESKNFSNIPMDSNYVDLVSEKPHDALHAVASTNHRVAGWNLRHLEARKIDVANETGHFDLPLKIQQSTTASYSVTAQDPQTSSGTNWKTKQTSPQSMIPNRVLRLLQQRRHTEHNRLKELNHTEGTVVPIRHLDHSEESPSQEAAEQQRSTANPLESNNQKEAHKNTTTHKLRHERRHRIFGRHQTNTSRHLNEASEYRKDSHPPNISHPTYNVYNFYGPVVITDGAFLPIGSNEVFASSKETGALTNLSYNNSNGLYLSGERPVSSEALNETRNFNYSSLANNGMTMMLLPTRFANRLLLQNYNYENDGSVVQGERVHGLNINSAGSLYNEPNHKKPPITSHYDNPSLNMAGGFRPPPAWSGGTHQKPATLSAGVSEYNTGTLNTQGYAGNDPYYAGAGSVGSSSMGYGLAPDGTYPGSDMLRSGTWSPPYNGPTSQPWQIPGSDNPGGQWPGFSGATNNPNGAHTYSTGNVYNNGSEATPLPGGRVQNAQVLTQTTSGGKSINVLNPVAANSSDGKVTSTANAGNYDSSSTGYGSNIFSGVNNPGMGHSDGGGTVTGNFPAAAPGIGTGVGTLAIGSMPKQGSHFGPIPDDTWPNSPATQQESGWKIRARIGFEWNPEHSGITDTRMSIAPTENAWGDQVRDQTTFYDPPMGAPPYAWQNSPSPYLPDYNANYPSRDQVYGDYRGLAKPPGDFMLPPYVENGRSAGGTGYMWVEGDIWRDYPHREPDFRTPQYSPPTAYSGWYPPMHGPPGGSSGGAGYSAHSPSAAPGPVTVTHTGATLVGGVPFGAVRRTPSGPYSSRRPIYRNQYTRPRPQNIRHNPNLLLSLG